MSGRARGVTLPRTVNSALRELVNALGKAAMYPPGHRFVSESAAGLVERLGDALTDHDSLTIGILPRGLLLDGTAVEPLPAVLREFAVRMHRKNIGTIHITRGIDAGEVAALIAALSPSNADETVGREGLRLDHARIEPMTYDVLAFADAIVDRELDDVFWMALVEAAFGRRLIEGDVLPTAAQIAEAMSERASESHESAQRVYEALAGFSAALASRGEQTTRNARRRFVDVLSSLSRPTTTRIVAAAPSPTSRRRFVRNTLQLVPPALLLQLLESVAEADGEPISPQLRWLLGKLAGGGPGEGVVGDGFTEEVLGLVQQWDLVFDDTDEETDPRLGLEPARVLAVGLELNLSSPRVIDAARRLAERGNCSKCCGCWTIRRMIRGPRAPLPTRCSIPGCWKCCCRGPNPIFRSSSAWHITPGRPPSATCSTGSPPRTSARRDGACSTFWQRSGRRAKQPCSSGWMARRGSSRETS